MTLDWLWWRACVPVNAVVAAAVGVAGVALGDMDVHFAWQAWHSGDIDLHFAWQAWHLSHWTGSGGVLGSQLTPLSPRLLAWQAWRLATSALQFAWQVWHLATSTVTLRGRRGAYGTGLALVARLGPS